MRGLRSPLAPWPHQMGGRGCWVLLLHLLAAYIHAQPCRLELDPALSSLHVAGKSAVLPFLLSCACIVDDITASCGTQCNGQWLTLLHCPALPLPSIRRVHQTLQGSCPASGGCPFCWHPAAQPDRCRAPGSPLLHSPGHPIPDSPSSWHLPINTNPSCQLGGMGLRWGPCCWGWAAVACGGRTSQCTCAARCKHHSG